MYSLGPERAAPTPLCGVGSCQATPLGYLLCPGLTPYGLIDFEVDPGNVLPVEFGSGRRKRTD
jgi:hypothetical protein